MLNIIEERTLKYEFLLFDVDNTILDFDQAEANALRLSLLKSGLPFNECVLEVYKRHNLFMWEQLELGKVTKDEVLSQRFLRTFAELGWTVPALTAKDIMNEYEHQLHNGFDVIPHAREILAALKAAGYRLFVVSNGVLSIQTARMGGSGLGEFFEQRFISEEIGYPKPQREFFDRCFASIDGFNNASALIIGDSLTSDIQGGINAQIDTCWFNPLHKVNAKGIAPTYEIDDLKQLLYIV